MVPCSLPRWSPAYREKMAYATAYFITDAQVTGRCLQTLLRDVVVKDGKYNLCLDASSPKLTTQPSNRHLHRLHYDLFQGLPRVANH